MSSYQWIANKSFIKGMWRGEYACSDLPSYMKGSENALLNFSKHWKLLSVPLNYLSKHILPNFLYVYSDAGCVKSSFYTFNALCGMRLAQVCGTCHIKKCCLKKILGRTPACTCILNRSSKIVTRRTLINNQ